MTPLDYRKRLGLGMDDKIKISRFYARMHNYFVNAGSIEFEEIAEQVFCNKIGAIMANPKSVFEIDWSNSVGLSKAWKYMEHYEDNFPELLFRCVCLVNVFSSGQDRTKKALCWVITDALEDCQIPYELMEDDDGIFIFPKGAKELDDALVSQPLTWLKDYPVAEKAWIKALRIYSDKTEEKASDIADLFRKALEAFFREFFPGNKALENYKSEYGAYLKAHGVPKEISANFETLLLAYTNYMNGYAKHRDATSDKVLEYLMYQTGNIMRLLITLEQEADHAD